MIRIFYFTLFVASLLIAGCSASQKNNSERSPYAGEESREIKALSAKQISGYLNGRGMGFSKVAELNHYPGPKHVLELSEKLHLSNRQLQKTEKTYDEMKVQAQNYGQALVEKERRLDRLFANENLSRSTVETLLHEIGALKAKLRFIHIQAHIKMKRILTPEQIKEYDRLRGYTNGSGSNKHHHQNHET